MNEEGSKDKVVEDYGGHGHSHGENRFPPVKTN